MKRLFGSFRFAGGSISLPDNKVYALKLPTETPTPAPSATYANRDFNSKRKANVKTCTYAAALSRVYTYEF